MDHNKIVVFESKQVRRIWHNEQWYFSIVDVCRALTDSPDAGAYWRKLKQRLNQESSQIVTFCHGLKLEARDGKKYATDCANTEGLFRIIQSIPSPKAEPFKRWHTFDKSKKVAKRGGSVAGTARKATEKELGRTIISRQNYLEKKTPKRIED